MKRGQKSRAGKGSVLEALPPGHLYFTKDQLAEVLQVSIRCVTLMMARGEIPFLKLRNGFVRFRLEDVARHLNETVLVGGEEQKLKAEAASAIDHGTTGPRDNGTSTPNGAHGVRRPTSGATRA